MVAEQQVQQAAPVVVDADRWVAALKRATAGRVIVYKSVHYGVWHVTSATQPGTEYTVQTAGPRWYELTCTCEGGQHGRVCLHQAAAAFARKHRVYAIRPQ